MIQNAFQNLRETSNNTASNVVAIDMLNAISSKYGHIEKVGSEKIRIKVSKIHDGAYQNDPNQGCIEQSRFSLGVIVLHTTAIIS